MAQLRSLSDFNQTFQQLSSNIIYFEENIENTIFNEDEDLTDEENFQEAENVYQRNEQMIVNLTTLSENDDLPPNLRELVEHNMNVLYQRENNLITQMIRLKKRIVNEREYREYKTEMDARRHETPEQRKERVSEEVLEEAREERLRIEELKEEITNLFIQMRQEREQLPSERFQRMEQTIQGINETINNLGNTYQTKEEFNTTMGNYSTTQEISSTYETKANISQQIQNINETINNLGNTYQTIEEFNNKEIEINNELEQCVKKSELINTLSLEQMNLEVQEIQQIETWTEMKVGEVVFDTNIHKWDVNDDDFNQKVGGKEKLLFLIEDDRGYKFGCYYETIIEENRYGNTWGSGNVSTNNKTFIFSLKYNNRESGMMKFNMINTNQGYYRNDSSGTCLIHIGFYGAIHLEKSNNKSRSYCHQHNNSVDYGDIENALIPDSLDQDSYFTPKRITVIQMI